MSFNVKLVSFDKVEGSICKDVKSEEVKDILNIIIPQMKEIVKIENGIGLAAPQIGINKKFFIVWDEDNKDYIPYFNASYIKDGNSRIKMEEGCLSYEKGNSKLVKRYKNIILIYEEWDGEKLIKKRKPFSGIFSIVMQHECDHLKGITIYTK